VSKKPEESKPPAAPGYIVSYAALMTILLAFFILVSTMAPTAGGDLKAKGRLEPFVKSFSARGIPSLYRGSMGPTSKPFIKQSYLQDDIAPADPDAATSEERIVEPNTERLDRATVDSLTEGATVQLPLLVAFDDSGVTIRADSAEAIAGAAAIILESRCFAAVRVYLSESSSGLSRFPSPWALSGARAIEIVRRLSIVHGVPAGRVQAIGCGTGPPLLHAGKGKEMRFDRVVISLSRQRPTAEPKLWKPVQPRSQLRMAN